jgi:hypothetical protein
MSYLFFDTKDQLALWVSKTKNFLNFKTIIKKVALILTENFDRQVKA